MRAIGAQLAMGGHLPAFAIAAAAASLWTAGLWLFARAESTVRRKVAWVGILVAIGVGAAFVLPLDQLWRKFLWALALVPLLALVDLLLLRPRRGLTYWVRACGFEIVTVFGVAALARAAFDAAGIVTLVR